MKKMLISMLVVCSMVLVLTACGGNKTESNTPNTQGQSTSGDEMVDGRFTETRTITVEIYDRGNDGGSDPTDNMYTDYIKENMLEMYNIAVEFVPVPRWTEVDAINNLLAAGDAPFICYTYDYPTIKTYAGMGGVLDLSGYLEEYSDMLPNLWDLLTDGNIYWNEDPVTGELWAIEARLAVSNRVTTFVRADWLNALGLDEPTTKQEFEEMLQAFKENAELLLGSDAGKLIPYSVGADVGWRAMTLIESFMDPQMSDREFFIKGFDERRITQDGTKEAVALLNKWYNDGLLWNDFALYGDGDTTEEDMMKAGYIGAFTHNWDQPYRNGEDSIEANLKRLVGEEASYIVVDCFEDRNGDYTKFVPGPIDRKIFFPTTNTEPLASLLYLDFISTDTTIEYLQMGDEGVTHNVLNSEDGDIIEIIAGEGTAIQNSTFNIDYTMTSNGLKFVDAEKTLRSRAYSYANVDAALVERANEVANTNLRIGKNVNVGEIVAEEGVGSALSEKRNIIYVTSVVAAPEAFDSVWDNGMADYLSSGGKAIMEEREVKWIASYGDVDQLPE